MRYGHCKNCWYWLPDRELKVSLYHDAIPTGTCYAASNYPPSKTKATTYCPDYINRRKGNKDGKLQDMIKQYGESK